MGLPIVLVTGYPKFSNFNENVSEKMIQFMRNRDYGSFELHTLLLPVTEEGSNLTAKKIKSLQWHSYEVQGIENNKDITLLASSPVTKYQIFKYQNHAYGIQFHIEIKDTTVNEWGCVPEYKKALEDQLGNGALEKFDNAAKNNMSDMNNYSKILYENFKTIL